MVSNAVALTNQFYEWERRGRGWTVAEYACDLEPPFSPFFGHFIEPGEIIDDGKRPSFWSALASGFTAPDKPANTGTPKEQDAYPYSGTSGQITIYAITLPKHFKQSTDRIGEFLVMLSYRKSPGQF